MNTTATERILVVESDMGISSQIAHQILEPLGYQVRTAADAGSAIQQVAQFAPDLVITNLELPGLSGKDLLVALHSQGNAIPLIVIAEKGQESNVIQAFRLGASDYLLWPAREAEVVSAVERVTRQVHDRRASQKLGDQLQATNQELQQRLRELTTIFAVGKAVISITDQRILFEKIVEGVVYVAEADYGWLLLKDERTGVFNLTSQRGLPASWAKKMGSPLDDGISSLVALSGEMLAIHGASLERFKVVELGRSAVVAPLKIQQDVIGLVVVVRKADVPFSRNTQTLLEAICDYASISLVNAHLFRALQETADGARAGENHKLEQLQALRKEVQDQVQHATYPLELVLTGKMGDLNEEQLQAVKMIQTSLQRVLQLVELDRPSRPLDSQ
jgi:DNA-binding response OmpR family regulator